MEERTAAAAEAKKIAWLAAARADGDVSREELQAVEEELDTIGTAWRAASGSLAERTRSSSAASQEAMSQEMAFIGGSLYNVFGKIGDLISVADKARLATFKRQHAVQDKVRRMQKRLMEVSGVDEDTFRRKLMELRTKDIENRKKLEQKVHDTAADAQLTLEDEEKQRKFVKVISGDVDDESKLAESTESGAEEQTAQQLAKASERIAHDAANNAKSAEAEVRKVAKPQQQWLTQMRGDADDTAKRTAKEDGRIEGTAAEKIALINSDNNKAISGAEVLGKRASELDAKLSKLTSLADQQIQNELDTVSDPQVAHAPGAAFMETADLASQMTDVQQLLDVEEAKTTEIERHNAKVRNILHDLRKAS
jgi:hypothetical protein